MKMETHGRRGSLPVDGTVGDLMESEQDTKNQRADSVTVAVALHVEENELDSDEDDMPAQPLSIEESRRIANTQFDTFVSRKSMQEKSASTQISQGDEYKSTQWLFKQASSTEIISNPREYQVELFERAKERNIIAVLDTGSGKTLISMLLLQHVIDKELEDRSNGQAHRVSFFLVSLSGRIDEIEGQHEVLMSNIDQPMTRLWGDMGCDLWTEEVWRKQFSSNMVIVCTADILYQCLHRAFITISQINILIFDEAHHAKKNHAYARIIKDFYVQSQGQILPKIFGMTASPVDARVDVEKASLELETLLNSEIATASDTSLLKNSVTKRENQIAPYPLLHPPFETKLFQRLKSVIGEHKIFSRPARFSLTASSQLGQWCADRVWELFLAEKSSLRLAAKTESDYLSSKILEPLEVLETALRELKEAHQIVASHIFESPTVNGRHISTKVMALRQFLMGRYERPTDDKCIIFVDQRYTAILLSQLFANPAIGTSHLRVGFLVGSRSSSHGDFSTSMREQQLTVRKFRKGEVNCLFATSIAEEGLDIPDCNLVIRFDLYKTLIQYIQSRGRARLNNSKFVHMVESGNKGEMAHVAETMENEDKLRKFCECLPDDRRLTGNDYNLDFILKNEKSLLKYVEPETGAVLNYRMSLIILSAFASSLRQTSESNPQPDYIMTSRAGQFICEVILPEHSPVRRAIGRPAGSKQLAKCSAAFEMCLMLKKGKYIDGYFRSCFGKQLPTLRNAVLAIKSTKPSQLAMRIKPTIWSRGGVPEELWMTVLTLAEPSELGRASQPIAILTRSKLVQIPQFPLYFDSERSSKVICLAITSSLKVTEDSLKLIDNFTLRIFKDIFSKEYQSDISKCPYFLVPVKDTPKIKDIPAHDLVDWDVLDVVFKNPSLTPEGKDEAFFRERFVIDPFDGSRKLWTVGISHDYTPLDPPPPDTAPRTGPRKKNGTIMDYSCSLWGKSREAQSFSVDQPVVEAEVISLRRNLLDHETKTNIELPKKCFVILEPLMISALPVTVVAMAYVFPAIIHRLESYLIAAEVCEQLHLNVNVDLALEAITKDSDFSDEHQTEQISFQRGMGKNYERLEFFGDCFLKMATSIALFTEQPSSDEGVSHVERMEMICNKNLLQNAQRLGIHEYIRSQSFNRRAWYPEGLVLKRGKAAKPPNSHDLADKTVADVCEALIGAALLTAREAGNMDGAVRAVTLLVGHNNHTMLTFGDYYKRYKIPTYQQRASTASQRDLVAKVYKTHSYLFKYPRLLRSAFIHPSYPYLYENVPSYQRLEFLGDALLDMVCVNYLFYLHPNSDPQWLTEHKMAMVSNHFLGALCVSLGFHKHMRSLGALMKSQISEYVAEHDEARSEAMEEAVKAGKRPDQFSPDYWMNIKKAPKCLSDLVEAYIGALFVDSEYDFGEVERFFDCHIKPYFEDIALYDTFANNHPVTFLFNFLSVQMGCQDFSIKHRELPSDYINESVQVMAGVMVHGEVIASSQGINSRYTKVNAAKSAMAILQGLSVQDFKRTYNCRCVSDVGEAAQTTQSLASQ